MLISSVGRLVLSSVRRKHTEHGSGWLAPKVAIQTLFLVETSVKKISRKTNIKISNTLPPLSPN